jgi:glycosyltransferase involved in cell wall biosynthesis
MIKLTGVDRKIRVLFLPKWYPNRYDPMEGLFIQRQAEALTPFCDVAVIYVHPDAECPNKYEVEFSEEKEVRVLRVYYRTDSFETSAAGKTYGFWRFYRANMKAVHSIRQFSPELIHAHILTRMGLIGWKVSRAKHVPLVISEHWSRYFSENDTYHGWFRKWLTSFIVKKAGAVIAVSEPLRDAMQKCHLENPGYRVIPNVVDAGIFHPGPRDNGNPVKTIVHVSCFEDKSKNISGFLRSLKELSGIRQDFHCMMVGDGPDWDKMKEYAGSLGILDTFVSFTGLKTEEELTEILGKADFSVLSSRYETFATVLIESLACGVPVVSTSVGVAPVVINESNGMLVPPGDEQILTGALNRMVDQCRTYDREAIRAGVLERYSRETVGKDILEIYREVL